MGTTTAPRNMQALGGLKADVVLCQDPRSIVDDDSTYLNHPDHRAAGQAALDAAFPAAGNPSVLAWKTEHAISVVLIGPELGAPKAFTGADTVVHAIQFPNAPVEDPSKGRTYMEVDGRGTYTWADMKAARPDWIRNKTVNILVQFGREEEPHAAA